LNYNNIDICNIIEECLIKNEKNFVVTLIGLFRSPPQNVCKETVNFFQDGFKLFLMTYR